MARGQGGGGRGCREPSSYDAGGGVGRCGDARESERRHTSQLTARVLYRLFAKHAIRLRAAPSHCPAASADDRNVKSMFLSVSPVHSCAWNAVCVAGGGFVCLNAGDVHMQKSMEKHAGGQKGPIDTPFSVQETTY